MATTSLSKETAQRLPEPLEALESKFPSAATVAAWDARRRAQREAYDAYAVEDALERRHGLATDYDAYAIEQEADDEYWRRMGEV